MAANCSSEAQEFPLSTIRISIADMIALRVRKRNPGESARPDFLYQSFPAGSLSLMATLPCGGFPVSFTHRGELGLGFPVGRFLPADPEGWVVIYALQPNRFYEAIEIFFEGKRFGVEDFCRLAKRRVKQGAGALQPIPGRYLYFAPTIELWGTTMENHGYTVADPATAPAEITPRMREIRESPMTSGVLARVPSYTGDKLPPGTVLPVFAQVEVALEPRPGPRSNWVGFAEHQRKRRKRSQPPAVLLPEFAGWLKQLAADSGCESWLFRRGMLFGDPGEWWGDKNLRPTRHEGLDFSEGKQGGETRRIPDGTPVRAMMEGDFIAVLDDFLGKTVVLLHPSTVRPDGTVFCTMYSHIHPEAGLSRAVYRGQLLGRVAKSRTAGAPAHLHITGAWIPKAMDPGEITMDRINPGYDPVVLVDFNSLLQKAIRDSKSWIPG